MPKRKASPRAILCASEIYDCFFPRIGTCWNRLEDAQVTAEIIKNDKGDNKNYFRACLRATMKAGYYPYEYKGGFDLDLTFVFAVPRYASSLQNSYDYLPSSYDYLPSGTGVIRRSISPNWQRLEKSKAITSIASSCEGVLRDGKLISQFYINTYVPLQSAILESLIGTESRTRECRIVGESGVAWYRHQRPVKCLLHGEWNCRKYIQNWVLFYLEGKELNFKQVITNNGNLHQIKPIDLYESIKKISPMCRTALAEIEREINSEEFKRKKLMRVVKPLFEKRERGDR